MVTETSDLIPDERKGNTGLTDGVRRPSAESNSSSGWEEEEAEVGAETMAAEVEETGVEEFEI